MRSKRSSVPSGSWSSRSRPTTSRTRSHASIRRPWVRLSCCRCSTASSTSRRSGRGSAPLRPKSRQGSIAAVEAYAPEPGLVVQLTPRRGRHRRVPRARPRRARDRARAAARSRARGRRGRRRAHGAVGEGREARGARSRDDRRTGRGGRRPCRCGVAPSHPGGAGRGVRRRRRRRRPARVGRAMGDHRGLASRPHSVGGA